MSRLAIRLALLWLAAGAGLGAWMLALAPHRAGELLLARPLHAEGLLVGWLVQLAIGVGYWILPRRPGRPPQRGRAAGAWSAVVLLNLGVLSAGAAPWSPSPAGWTFAGRALEALAVAAFAWHALPRVRAASAG